MIVRCEMPFEDRAEAAANAAINAFVCQARFHTDCEYTGGSRRIHFINIKILLFHVWSFSDNDMAGVINYTTVHLSTIETRRRRRPRTTGPLCSMHRWQRIRHDSDKPILDRRQFVHVPLRIAHGNPTGRQCDWLNFMRSMCSYACLGVGVWESLLFI